METSDAYQLLQNEPESVTWIFPEPVHLRIGPWRHVIERNMVLLTEYGRAHKLRGVTKSNYRRRFAGWLRVHASVGRRRTGVSIASKRACRSNSNRKKPLDDVLGISLSSLEEVPRSGRGANPSPLA